MSGKAAYSIIIPVLKMDGNPYLDSILESLKEQTFKPEAVHLVAGDRRQGRAINYGVKQSNTKYIGTVDDDTQIDDPELFRKLIDALENDSSIGMAGAACEIPESASKFQKKAMRQIPRRFFPVQKENTDSDMVQHPCLVMRRDLFLSIGGEDEELIRGLDPVLRKKVRDAGKRVAIIANTRIYHLIPDGLIKVMKMYYRNGRGSGYASRNYPGRVIELGDGYEKGEFTEKRPFIFRVFRRILSLLLSIIKMQFIKVAADSAYILGVIKEKLFPSYIKIPEVKRIKTEERSGYPFRLFVHSVELDT
jgi:glycosyltransferase involved in cell wall biosynthesis